MKKPTRDEREQMCIRKRRYRTEADALDAALRVTGQWRSNSYRCPLCNQWHLTSQPTRDRR